MMAFDGTLVRRIEAAVNTIAEAVATAEACHRRRGEQIERDLNAELLEIRMRADEALARARQAHEQEMAQVEHDIRRVEEGAGLWAAPWESPVWSGFSLAPAPPSVVRLGTLTVAGATTRFTTPALLPFTAGRNLVIKASGEAKARAAGAVQSLVLRLLVTVPPAKLRLLLIDPVGLGQNVAAFMPLSDVLEELVTSKAWTEPGDIEKRLADLSSHMEMVIQKYLRNRYPDMEVYNQQAEEVAEPYRLLVIMNFPANFTDQSARRLISIATNGPRCGVFTLVTVDTEQPHPYGFNLEDLERTATVVAWDGGRFVWQEPEFERHLLELDSPPSTERFEALVRAVGAAAKEASKVELPFAKIAPREESWWAADTVGGLVTPIGRAGAHNVLRFELGQGTAVHALMAGRPGSGKSTLMHILIMGFALTYPPQELELYLVDFKKGVEFKDYVPASGATTPLPHARVIAVESEREFGVSCLEALNSELARRGELFRQSGCNDFPEYRQKTKAILPRILLLVDEFQEFFTEDDGLAHHAALLLDRLARQGRGFGIHMVLGSQTLAGAFTLARSTLDLMAVRIALQCSEADSRVILAEDNPQARLLSRPGEAIYNTAGGLEESNILFQIAWLDDGQKTDLLRRLHTLAEQKAVVGRSPVIFEGSRPAQLGENQLLESSLAAATWPRRGRATAAWLGQPVAIKDPTSALFSANSGRHLLVVGRDEGAAIGMVAAAIIGLAAQLSPAEASFYLIDCSTADSEWAYVPEAIAKELPHTVQVIQRRKVCEAIQAITKIIEERQDSPNGPTVYLIGFGMHRVRELREDNDGFESEGANTAPSLVRQLLQILKDGPERGVHVLAWWDSYASLCRIGRRAVSEFGIRVVLPMGADDSSALLDGPDAARLGPNRALLWDEERVSVLEKFIPYGVPPREWLARTSERLRARGARRDTGT
jgi:S-DNA-T family DNA segregation ATPase FtsK/SpoIIIE